MKSHINLPNSAYGGFTLVEAIVTLGITTIVGLFGFQILRNTNLSFNKMNTKVEGKIDEKIGERILLKDIRLSSPSMNSIKLLDDNGLNFFDYDSDKTSDFYKSQKNISRTFTLKQDGKKVFYFLIYDESRGKTLFTDPISFFELGASPDSVTAASSLTYRGLNYKNYLTVNGPGYLDDKQLVMADSSSSMTSSFSHLEALFIGLPVTAGGLVDLKKVDLPDKIFSYDIMEENNTVYTPKDFQDYLINMPIAGANGANVRLKGIKLLKYQLECTTTGCDLYRSDISALDPALEKKNLVLKGCKMVTLFREDTSVTIFKIDVIKEEIK